METHSRLFTGFLLTHQVSLDKSIQFPIHDRLHIAHFKIGPVIFDHFIGMKYITADLAAPLDLFLFGIGGIC